MRRLGILWMMIAVSIVTSSVSDMALAQSRERASSTQQAQAAPPPTLANVCKGKRSTKGAIIGGIGGAIVGGLTKGVGGAIIGAAAGAGVGYLLGKHWDKKACAESQKAMDLAMSSGTSQSWKSDDGQKSYTLAVDKHFTGATPIDRSMPTLDGRDIDLSDMSEARDVYVVSTPRTNVRDKPNLTSASKVLDNYKSGQRLMSMAATANGQWLLVSTHGDAAEGWVRSNTVRKTGDDPRSFAQSGARPVHVTRVAMRPSCIESHEVFAYNDNGKQTVSNSPAAQQCRNDQGVFVSNDVAKPAKQG